MTLLAKQAWWLLHNKTSLFYKVFKAHFFPNSSLIEVADSRLGSYAWKSILRGRDIIQRGAICRVGSGEKINIWQQHWLPRKHPPRQPSCPIESFENHIVDSLIDPITRKWNEELIDGLFVEEDPELIKRIPLSQIAKEDSLYWPYSTSGHYTCKSSYNFLKQESKMQDSPQAPPIHDKQVWKEIWQLKVPPKIKNFLWRACRNALPTKQALMKRKITANSICERCKSAVEEAEHALWSCLELEVVWADREVWCFRSEVGFSDVKELVSWLIAEGKPLELFAYTAWMVWNQRNKARLNLQVIPLHQVADQAKELLAQYRVKLQVPKVQLMNSGSRGSRWRCPQVGLVKINFDGAICSEANMSGIGVVIRDDKGAVLASCSEKIPRACKADEIEALAAMKPLSFAFELGFWSAILDGDSLGLIQALKSEEQSLAPTGLLIEDVKMFANNYVRLLYSHIKRNGNRVAHSLAKNVLHIPNFQVWMEDVSSHIVSILQLDVVDLH